MDKKYTADEVLEIIQKKMENGDVGIF